MSDQFNENATFNFSDWEWCLDWMKCKVKDEDVKGWEFAPSEDEGDEEKFSFVETIEELESHSEVWKVNPKMNSAVCKLCKTMILQLLKNCSPKVYRLRFNRPIMKAAVDFY